MERLLAFRSLPHDPQCVLATVQPLALVLGKLLSEALLCLGCALEGIDRHFEIPSAVGAHTNGRNGSKPFDYAEISLFQASVSHRAAQLGYPLWKSNGATTIFR